MPEFSEVLRQRLASREGAQDHPDADTLTAYAEKLLPAAERNRVLEHLALCRDCRDTAVLAFGDPQPDSAVQRELAAAPARKRSRWAWRPAFGLAASVGAMAVVAMVLIRLPHQQRTLSGQQEQAKVEAPQPPSAPVAQPAPEQTTNNAAGTLSADIGTRAAKPTDREQTPKLAKARVADLRATASYAALADRAEASPAPPVIETQSHIAAIVAAAPARRDYLNQNVFAANSLRNASTVGEIPAATALDQNSAPQSAQLSLFPDLSERPMAPPAKTLAIATATGHNGFLSLPKIADKAKKFVQRGSLPIGRAALTFNTMGGSGQFNPATGSSVEAKAAADQKKSAELDQTQAFTARALNPAGAPSPDAAAAASSMWVVADGKLLKQNESGTWVNGYTGRENNIEFSSVNVHGAELWAGANHATLLHSRDAGATWERVRVGESAAGNIISISVSGSTIQLQTSENQTWSSDDGGKTWAQN